MFHFQKTGTMKSSSTHPGHSYIFRLLLIALLTGSGILQTHGQNLVCNHQFESYSACPTNVYTSAPPWTFDVDCWESTLQPFYLLTTGNTSSADYYNACSVGSADVPVNAYGNQGSFPNGDGYVGIGTYHTAPHAEVREYVSSKLLSPMVAGTCYRVSMRVSLADEFGVGINEMGILFTNTDPTGPPTLGASNYEDVIGHKAQIENQSPLLDKDNWMLVTGLYRARGGEEYITIGNFNRNKNTCAAPNLPNSSISYLSYYYIDNVRVTARPNCQSTCQLEPKFESIVNGCEVKFKDHSTMQTSNYFGSILSHKWTFGDGSSSSEENPIHHYQRPGTYQVCLTVRSYDGSDCCTDIVCETIEVKDCIEPCSIVPSFYYDCIGPCDFLFFGSIVSANRTVTGWHWDFGDGNTAVGGPESSHTYTMNGAYTVCLTLISIDPSGDCCIGKFCLPVTVVGCSSPKLAVASESPAPDEKVLETAKVSIFPNPFSNKTMMGFSNPYKLAHNLQVVDLVGKEIYSVENIYEDNIEIDGSQWGKGIYLYRLTLKGELVGSGRMVVQ